jgi:FlgD Ig-like domain
MNASSGRSACLLLGLFFFGGTAGAADTAFRITDIDLRDPHTFVSFIGCRDFTDVALGGISFNGGAQTRITTDSNGDGLFDSSTLILFTPLDQGGASGSLRYGAAACTTGTPACVAAANSLSSLSYLNGTSGQCLNALAGTTHGYSPAIVSPGAPCFVTDEATITFDQFGIPMTLHHTRIAATYVGSPATSLANGLIRGFLSEADANATIIPASYALVGGLPLSAILPGGTPSGTTCCAAFSDKDVVDGAPGWWFYMNFTASPVPYVDPTVSVPGDPMPRVFLGEATPNPFAASLSLDFSLDVASAIRLSVHDAQGRHVTDLVRGIQSPGRHVAHWNGRDEHETPLEAGIYFIRLEAGGRTTTRRVVLLR